MPSSHPLPDLKHPWGWLTTKAKKVPPKADPQSNTKRASFTNSTSLTKPEPALHRPQELKSPPPTAPTPSTTGSDSPGFKSRPLYRRTGSSPANRAEEQEEGEEHGLAMSGVNGRNLAASASVVMSSAKDVSVVSRIGRRHADGDESAHSASVGEDDGNGGGETGDGRGDTGRGSGRCL